MIITIDGPTASGKSTIALKIAQKLGWKCLSSGLLFRALAYILTTILGHHETELVTLKSSDIEAALDRSRFSFTLNGNGGKIFFDGSDITPYLKDSSVDQPASIIGTISYVRERLAEEQRRAVKEHNVVVEGRDVGSVVFPHAVVKFFLTAAEEIRAHRWQLDQEKRGLSVPMSDAHKMIKERDTRDKSRSTSPLVVPEGAFIIDSTELGPDETVAQLLVHINKALMQLS
jgi:cytidylate kinase